MGAFLWIITAICFVLNGQSAYNQYLAGDRGPSFWFSVFLTVLMGYFLVR